MEEIVSMIPGANKNLLQSTEMDEGAMARLEAIISSMTPDERRKPNIINGSRRQRIARGSGTAVQDVNQLLKQFNMMQKMMKRFGKMNKIGKLKNMMPF